MFTVVHRDQLFFIAFGRIWAENIKPAALVQRIRTDPHSPAQFRVDGTLHNVPEFAKAFNCSPKAKVCFSMPPTCVSLLRFSSLTPHPRNGAFCGSRHWKDTIMQSVAYYLSSL